MAKEIEFKAGDRVQLTGKFLRSTGQIAGSEGQKKWTVKGVHTIEHGSAFVIVDEPSITDYFTKDELEADPSLAFRRINAANLKHVGRPSSRDC